MQVKISRLVISLLVVFSSLITIGYFRYSNGETIIAQYNHAPGAENDVVDSSLLNDAQGEKNYRKLIGDFRKYLESEFPLSSMETASIGESEQLIDIIYQLHRYKNGKDLFEDYEKYIVIISEKVENLNNNAAQALSEGNFSPGRLKQLLSTGKVFWQIGAYDFGEKFENLLPGKTDLLKQILKICDHVQENANSDKLYYDALFLEIKSRQDFLEFEKEEMKERIENALEKSAEIESQPLRNEVQQYLHYYDAKLEFLTAKFPICASLVSNYFADRFDAIMSNPQAYTETDENILAVESHLLLGYSYLFQDNIDQAYDLSTKLVALNDRFAFPYPAKDPLVDRWNFLLNCIRKMQHAYDEVTYHDKFSIMDFLYEMDPIRFNEYERIVKQWRDTLELKHLIELSKQNRK